MQKGDNNARNLHIALNSLQVLLFLWQVSCVPARVKQQGPAVQFWGNG
jgi:hypothetical protein